MASFVYSRGEKEKDMRFIGDTHAKFDRYQAIASEAPASIQVGDFGAGFKPLPEMGPTHRFIRGNHDNPEVCAQSSSWIADGTIENGMFFMGGATSVDKHSRSEGVDYWSDEEVTIRQGYDLLDAYEAATKKEGRFDFFISHECPESIALQVFHNRRDKLEDHSRTRQILDAMLEISAPKCWIFGHWHHNIDVVIAHIDLTADQISG